MSFNRANATSIHESQLKQGNCSTYSLSMSQWGQISRGCCRLRVLSVDARPLEPSMNDFGWQEDAKSINMNVKKMITLLIIWTMFWRENVPGLLISRFHFLNIGPHLRFSAANHEKQGCHQYWYSLNSTMHGWLGSTRASTSTFWWRIPRWGTSENQKTEEGDLYCSFCSHSSH